jgi:uncharacterized protein
VSSNPIPENPAPSPPPPEAAPTDVAAKPEDRSMAMLCHLLGIFTGFIGPLIIWLLKKDQSNYVDDQGKESLNFQITLLIAHLVAGVAVCIHFGFLNLAIWVLTIVFGVLATVAANRGERYRYPFSLRLVK